MAYVKQNFKDGQTLKAEQLNHIETGIESLGTKLEDVETDSDIFFAIYGETTFAETKAAYDAGKYVVCQINHRDTRFCNLSSVSATIIVFDEMTFDGRYLQVSVSSDDSWESTVVKSVPSAHKSTHATGGNDALLPSDIGAIPAPATAEVGQLLSVKAVDANGAPTEWEVMDAPAGGEKKWTLIMNVDVGADVAGGMVGWNHTGLSVTELFFVYNNMVSTTSSASGLPLNINDVSTNQQCVKTNASSVAGGANGWTYAFIGPDGFHAIFGPTGNTPTNYAAGNLSTNYNGIPIEGDTIRTLYIWANPSHMPASGNFKVYGR